MCIIYNGHANALLDVGGGGLVFILQALGLTRYSTIGYMRYVKTYSALFKDLMLT